MSSDVHLGDGLNTDPVFNQETLNAERKIAGRTVAIAAIKTSYQDAFFQRLNHLRHRLFSMIEDELRWTADGWFNPHFQPVIGIDEIRLQHALFNNGTVFGCNAFIVKVSCSKAPLNVRSINDRDQV